MLPILYPDKMSVCLSITDVTTYSPVGSPINKCVLDITMVSRSLDSCIEPLLRYNGMLMSSYNIPFGLWRFVH